MNFDSYKNTLVLPRKNDFKTLYFYHKGRRLGVMLAMSGDTDLDPGVTQEDWDNAIGKMVGEEDFNKEEYRKVMDVYHTEDKRLYEKFKADLLAELGLTGHKKADRLFDMAWEDSHSDGYEAVYDRAEVLAGLLE